MEDKCKCKLKYRPKTEKHPYQLYLTSFSNGVVASESSNKIAFKAYECAATSDGIPRPKVKRILVADAGRLQYSGCNFGNPLYERGRFFKYHVGVLNKKSGKIKIYDTDMYNLKPILSTNELVKKEENERSYTEQRDTLTEAFGSKQRKKIMNARLQYGVENKDITIEDDNSASVENAKLNINNNVTEAIPPRNDAATSKEKVYKICDIISEEEHCEITPVGEILRNATMDNLLDWQKKSTYSKYVLQHVEREVGRMTMVHALWLAYYNYIVIFSKLKYNELRRKDPAPEIPLVIKSKFLEIFTETGRTEDGKIKRLMPPKMKDKLIAYALVLTFFIDDFMVDLSEIQADFKIPATRLAKVAYALGCHILTRKINGESVKYAELKIPLFTPKYFPKRKSLTYSTKS